MRDLILICAVHTGSYAPVDNGKVEIVILKLLIGVNRFSQDE